MRLWLLLQVASDRITGRIPGQVPGLVKGADVDR
jgi:hypothetical protein